MRAFFRLSLLRALVLVFIFGAGSNLRSAEQSSPSPAPAVEAWATLFQVIDRLRTIVAKRELSLVDPEDAIASAAVSAILPELAGAPDATAQKINWIVFVRDISAMHTVADAGQAEACAALLERVEGDFEKLQASTDPAVLKAARQFADRFTCPMHPDVIGKKGDLCEKCGMPLDQPIVLLPSQLNLKTQHSVAATITTDAPLEPGKLAHAILHLRRSDGQPVTLAELIETHTKKIHLLIVDASLTDYHHEHPQPTATPGDYTFEFTPRKPGSYFAWADLRPTPLGLQEYEKAVIAGTGQAETLTDKEPRFSGDSGGLHFALTLDRPEVKVGQSTVAKLRVTRPDGSGFHELEPVMAAFAHIVGFNEDDETVLHMHPLGAPILNEAARGGPELEFRIYPTKPGFTRLFAQVKVDGRQVFVPFGLRVLP